MFRESVTDIILLLFYDCRMYVCVCVYKYNIITYRIVPIRCSRSRLAERSIWTTTRCIFNSVRKNRRPARTVYYTHIYQRASR